MMAYVGQNQLPFFFEDFLRSPGPLPNTFIETGNERVSNMSYAPPAREPGPAISSKLSEVQAMWHKAGLLVIAAAGLALLSSYASRSTEVAIQSVADSPAKFDHESVSVEGTVAALRETTSRAGNDYSTFMLRNGRGDALKVFIWGHPTLMNGDHVRVDGTFETEHHTGRYTFYNELEATTVTPSR